MIMAQHPAITRAWMLGTLAAAEAEARRRYEIWFYGWNALTAQVKTTLIVRVLEETR